MFVILYNGRVYAKKRKQGWRSIVVYTVEMDNWIKENNYPELVDCLVVVFTKNFPIEENWSDDIFIHFKLTFL